MGRTLFKYTNKFILNKGTIMIEFSIISINCLVFLVLCTYTLNWSLLKTIRAMRPIKQIIQKTITQRGTRSTSTSTSTSSFRQNSNIVRKSNIFKKCKFCGKISIMGICRSCKRVTVCSWCKKVVKPDYQPTFIGAPEGYEISHTICKPCSTAVIKESRL